MYRRARVSSRFGMGGMRRDPLLANVKGDPRWNAFLHTMGLADDQLK